MPEFIYWSATRMAREIRAGNLSSSEIVRACLDRINEVNPAINAVIQLVAERATREAAELDLLAGKSQFKGPLHGVPITVKDSLDTAGIISTGGTLGRKNFIPQVDAPVVARLRQAGAVLLGKTNTPELTLSGETNNLLYGRTNNPFDLSCSPGGSSGASAAIIACAGSALELGSDTGGSIREPAHLCGITGIKPTSGRTPRSGHIISYDGGVMDSLTQIGPMARYVEDLMLALPIICGPDGRDPSVVPVFMGEAKEIEVSQLRIAWYADNGIVSPHEDIGRVVSETAKALQGEGLNISESLMPGMKQLIELSTQLRETNAGMILRLLKRYGTTKPGPDLQGYLTEKSLQNASTFDPALMEAIDAARSRALGFFTDYDAIICPPSHCIARPHRASHADTFDDWSYITIYNLLGWPGVTVRAGSSGDGRLPVSVQVVTAPWREDIALALAAKIESIMGGYEKPPITEITASV